MVATPTAVSKKGHRWFIFIYVLSAAPAVPGGGPAMPPRSCLSAARPGHSTHFNVTTTAMAPRQLLSQPHCRDGPGTRSWAEYGAAAHARCVAPTLYHFGANSGQKRPGIRPASLGHGAPRERQRHRSVRRTKTAYFSHCECIIHVFSPQLNTVFPVFSVIHCIH